jgi:NAD-dependent deacetylase
MIEVAAKAMATADVFILTGTSLQVYPAAGLIEFLPPGISKYIIDKNPPYIPPHHNFIVIKKPATQGVEEVKNILIKNWKKC